MDDDDDEEMPEEVGKTYDTSERDGRYAPDTDRSRKRRDTNTQMEKCLRVRILKIKIDGQTETLIDRIGTVVYLIEEIFGCDNLVMLQANHGAEQRVHHNHNREVNKNHKTFCRTTYCNPAPHQASRRTPERECYTVHPSIKNT